MNKSIIPSLILISFIAVSCNQNVQIIPANMPGVSIDLAQYRKALLSKINYNLSLNVPDSTNRPVEATEEITFYLLRNVPNLEIDFKEATGHLLSIDVNGKQAQINHKNEHIIIPGKLLVKGTNRIRIDFIGGDQPLNRNQESLFTLFVPERARTFFPCFDQPNLKATFTLTAAIPSTWEAVSNAKIKNISTQASRKIFEFNPSDTISTYMFSLVAGKFNKVTRTMNGSEVNFYHRETDTAKIRLSLDTIFELHKQAVDFMESYTGIVYPFQKLDFIAIPDFQFGGLEHVGAINYKAATLFLDQSATTNDRIKRAHVIAHETAHMWFGNLVTMEWFNDVWLKEVFANFMADKILNVVIPDPDNQKRFLLEHHPLAYNVDRTEGTHPIRQDLTNLDHAGTLYGSIIYQKAPVVMRQLEKMTGESIMQQGLKKYLRDFSFNNANWPKLITILDSLSPEDISAWNDQWINKKGRPVLTYQMAQKDGKISGFTISQKNEHGQNEVWRQYFTIALVYENNIKALNVDMNDSVVVLEGALGLAVPKFILFNATGEGYGLFPIDSNMLSSISSLNSPVMRASAYINLYESTLEGKVVFPTELLMLYAKKVNEEADAEILNRISQQFRNIYWQFISPEERKKISVTLETAIWNAIQNSSGSGKKILLDTYVSIALSPGATNKIYEIWKSERAPAGISLSEEDYSSMASELAVRNHPQTASILTGQLKRIKNPDRNLKFEFLLKALSNDVAQRDAFFESLSDKKNRKKKIWVTTALGYLHHPLRAGESEKYLPQTLRLLDAVRSTGDIFFPTDWMRASFNYYQSESAKNMVETFLMQNPGYDESLKRVIDQETDDLFRAQKILNK